jgi:hypothetical protein
MPFELPPLAWRNQLKTGFSGAKISNRFKAAGGSVALSYRRGSFLRNGGPAFAPKSALGSPSDAFFCRRVMPGNLAVQATSRPPDVSFAAVSRGGIRPVRLREEARVQKNESSVDAHFPHARLGR